MFSKVVILSLVVVLVLSGCSAHWWIGDGRDWEKELANGYAITHINGNCICLTYKEDPESPGASYVINNLFVDAYFTSERYIALEGISLADVLPQMKCW